MQILQRLRKRNRRRGVLTLEWVLLLTVLIIGIIGGLAAVRNATVEELQEMSESIQNLHVKTEAETESES